MFTNQLDRQDCLRSKPYFIGAPGADRTRGLRFRKPKRMRWNRLLLLGLIFHVFD